MSMRLFCAKYKWLLVILALAFAFRLGGISYGLPLALIHDEPPFVFGALKMLELKTLVPALHSSEFESALYYPPYISYLYLPFFASAIGFKSLFFSGNFETLKNVLVADPSIFFLIARLISALLGTATVYLLYLIGRKLFNNQRIALLAALFLALSYAHTLFSHWGRHWVPVTFIFTLALYFLSKLEWSDKKRYLLATLVLGLGIGFNFQMAVGILILPIWYLFYDKRPLKEVFSKPWIWHALAMFVCLGLLAYFLYPAGLPVRGSDVFNEGKSLGGFLTGYVFHASNLVFNEPALLLFTLIGLVTAFHKERKFFVVSISFALLYIAVFYLLLFQVDRYVIMLLPLMALVAAFGLSTLGSSHPKLAIVLGTLVLTYATASIVRLDHLLIKNDTRIQAIEWVAGQISPGAKVVVLGDQLRLPSIPPAISLQEKIDPMSLRSVDRAERELSDQDNYYALNLYNVKAGEFWNNPTDYIKSQRFEYIILDQELVSRKELTELKSLGDQVTKFQGYLDRQKDLANWLGGGLGARETLPWFRGGFLHLWSLENLGPTIEVRHINYPQ